MSTNSVEDDCKKSAEDSILQATNNTDLENIDENTNKEKTKTVANAEIIVKRDESLKENLKRHIYDTDFMGYGYHGQNQALPTTWVYFQLAGAALPPNSEKLVYTPDRNPFIRVVFAIVFVMVALTAIVNVIFHILYNIIEEMEFYFRVYGMFVLMGGGTLMTILNYAMGCLTCTRKMPCNFICLFLAFIGMSIMSVFVTIRYDTALVMIAMSATAGTVLVCIGVAFSRFDFTRWLLYLGVIPTTLGTLSLSITGYVMMTGKGLKVMAYLQVFFGTITNVVVLIIELQMVLGGKSCELSTHDYALGAFFLYTSIINLFIQMIQLMGNAKQAANLPQRPNMPQMQLPMMPMR